MPSRRRMMIICVDNFNREGPGYDDRVVATGAFTNKEAETAVSALNALDKSPMAQKFYKVVPMDYKLYKFKP